MRVSKWTLGLPIKMLGTLKSGLEAVFLFQRL